MNSALFTCTMATYLINLECSLVFYVALLSRSGTKFFVIVTVLIVYMFQDRVHILSSVIFALHVLLSNVLQHAQRRAEWGCDTPLFLQTSVEQFMLDKHEKNDCKLLASRIYMVGNLKSL